jgi:hypothetical protein
MAYPDPINPDESLATLIEFKIAYIRKLRMGLSPKAQKECLEDLAIVERKIRRIEKAAYSGQVIRII